MAQQEAYTSYPLVDEAARRTSSVVRTLSEQFDACFQGLFACCFPLQQRRRQLRNRLPSQYDFDFDGWDVGGQPLPGGSLDNNNNMRYEAYGEETALLGGDREYDEEELSGLLYPEVLLRGNRTWDSKGTLSRFLSKLPFKTFGRSDSATEEPQVFVDIHTAQQSRTRSSSNTHSLSASTGEDSMRSRGELVEGEFEDAGMLGDDRILQLAAQGRVSSNDTTSVMSRQQGSDEGRKSLGVIMSPARQRSSTLSPRHSSPVGHVRTRSQSFNQRDNKDSKDSQLNKK